MSTKKEDENIPPTPQTDDEEFFKEHGIEDDDVKTQFRTRYHYDLYKEHRDTKRKSTQPPQKKKGLLDF